MDVRSTAYLNNTQPRKRACTQFTCFPSHKVDDSRPVYSKLENAYFAACSASRSTPSQIALGSDLILNFNC